MSKSARKRTPIDIMSELLALTHEMAKKKDDTDFLGEAIDRRGVLMEEFDKLKQNMPEAQFNHDKPEIRRMADEMLKLDKEIEGALVAMKSDAKNNLKESTRQNKVLNYTSKAISTSGSYMDYKE